jgi:hypothetical protein
MLRRMKAYVAQATLRTVYSALIMPHFDYCSLVLDNAPFRLSKTRVIPRVSNNRKSDKTTI